MVSFSEGRMIRRLAHAAVVTGFVGTDVPDWLARRIDAGLGGVCWFAQNVADESQATTLAGVDPAGEPVGDVRADEAGHDRRVGETSDHAPFQK